MGLAQREHGPHGHGAAPATDNLFRLAILQRHDLEAGDLLDRVAVEFQSHAGATVRAEVYTFAARSRRGTVRCFAWAQQATATTTIIHTMLESPTLTDAERVLRAWIAAGGS